MTSKHPQRCETCGYYQTRFEYGNKKICTLIKEKVPSSYQIGIPFYIDIVGCANHSSATEPAEWTLEEIVSGIQGAFDRGVIAGKKATREEVLELLSDLKGYADGEYEESNLSDNEREMRIHLEYTNRIWGIMRSLRGGAP